MYDSRENCNAIIETATNTLVTACRNTIISKSVTSIGENAFWNLWMMESIIIPKNVTSIGRAAFEYCNALTIYCEAESKPAGWHDNWNPSNRPVVWGYVEE